VFTREPEGDWTLPNEVYYKETLNDINITEETVTKLLDTVNTAKSPGGDGIHPRVLYECRQALAKPLCILFNLSLHTQSLPEDWKQASITAIFKKGSKKVAGNYRPVSLTSIVCKLLESVIRDALVSHMQKNNLFTDKQFGFIPGRSTTLQLIQVLELWTDILDRGNCVDIIYCDFMKAFDKVPHH
jgi:hypothetical protein